MKVKKAGANDPRSVISQGVIGLAICVGGYMMTVDPVNARLATAKAEEASLRAQARDAEALRDIVPQITAASARAKAEADRIHEAGRLARNEQDLYAALTSIANECNVRIDQMSPVKVATKAAPGQAVDPNASGLNAATGYAIDAAADYTDLTRFLRRIRTELGYAVVKTVRLTPTMDTRVKMVQAYIETEHYSFDASPVDLSASTGGAR
jgi:hypothetical protein